MQLWVALPIFGESTLWLNNMKNLTIFLLSALVYLQANAQKLPQVQPVSLRAPANVKIDGKVIEWGQMKAYNKPTELNYTIANDDKKLYLVVQTDVPDVYNRISNGGVKFVVQKNGSKSDDGAAFVKYPFFKEHSKFAFSFNKIAYSLTFGAGGLQTTRIPVKKITTTQQADSVMNAHNAILRDKLKFIYADGLPGTDNLVPIYNDQGIEAAVAFDNKKVYTCEMAIDLKLLGLTAKAGKKFAYHVVINGDPYKFNFVDRDGALPVAYTTDFWGEYTLAK